MDTFSNTMGEQDFYRETFALWVINTKVTKVNASDHRGEFRFGHGLNQQWRERLKLNCNTLCGKWICLQVCRQGCNTVKGIYTTKKSVNWPGLRIRLHGYSGTANANYLNILV